MKLLNIYRLTLIFILSLLITSNLYSQYKSSSQNNSEPIVTFGIIADCQYSNSEDYRDRKYSLSEQKLTECIGQFNNLDLDFVVQLGDFIDTDFVSYDTVLPIMKQLKIPYYHVLGNHDFSVSDEFKKVVPDKLNMTSRYYDFALKGCRFIFLDGNDISFYAYPENTQEHIDAEIYYQKHKINSPEWNGAIGAEQLLWLESTLKMASQDSEKVIIFCHHPVYPENEHNLWNAVEITKLIKYYACVKVFMSGHNHQGNYGLKEKIHYITFKGMVETEQTSYAVIQIYSDRLKINGYGREPNRVLTFR